MSQKKLLQFAFAVAGLVPVTAGALGSLWPEFLFPTQRPDSLTHGAYLSGLLLGIGLAFWSLIPSIERQRRAVTLLTGLVVLGGLARLAVAARLGVWGPSVLLPLVMELVVTPALWAWQRRVARPSLSSLE